jgi:hypothetical protein
MIYPGTRVEKYCIENNIELYNECDGDTNTGIPNIKFDEKTTKRLRNICKLATFFVKYNIDERWMRILMDVDFDDNTNINLSMTKYYECVVDRLGNKGKELFNDIKKSMKLRY